MRTRTLVLWLQASLTGLPALLAADDFYLRERREQAPEMGELLTYVFRAGPNMFSFVPPRNWQVGVDPERRRVVFQSPDRVASICLVISSRNQAQEFGSKPELLRHQVIERFTDARIAEEFPCYTSSHKGRGFQVQWTAAGQVPMASRVAYFTAGDRTLEFTLTTMANRFGEFQAVLGSLLTSFQQSGVPTSRLAQPVIRGRLALPMPASKVAISNRQIVDPASSEA
jgi:hypothetical protein